MNFIGNILGDILRIIYGFVQHYGLAIILFTIFVKLILLPLTIKQTKSMKAMQDIQPKMKEIQEKYKSKPEKQNEEIMKLYKESGANPIAGCLPLVIQFPILIGLYAVLRNPVSHGVFANAAAFKLADTGFLWVSSLTKPDIALAILSGITTFISQIMIMQKDQPGANKYMTYIMSFMMLFWGLSFPAGLTLYWTASNVFQIVQQYVIMKPLKEKLSQSEGDKK